MLLTGLPDSCSGCPISTNQKCGRFSHITGKGHSGVMIVGEASGEHEAREARPFVEHAPAGSILEKAIRLGGWKRDEFFITNVVRCRPPNNELSGADYESMAIAHCSSNLNSAIATHKPRAIVALGNIPLRELTGFYGPKRTVSYVRGYPLAGPGGIPVIPSYHPAYIARGNTRLIPTLIKDLASARSAAAGRLTYVSDPNSEIELREGPEALWDLYQQLVANPELWLPYDIETERSILGEEHELVEFAEEEADPDSLDAGDEEVADGEHRWGGGSDSSNEERDVSYNILDLKKSRILSIQFAISDQWGVYGDWSDGRVREAARAILGLSNPKVAHNGEHFDKPILESEGVIINGYHIDSLSLRKALQPDLPAGLQQVAVDYGWRWPWKHVSGSNAVLYGIADVCSLVRIISRLPEELDRLGMWDGYLKFVKEVRDKVEIPWEQRGIPMSKERLDGYRGFVMEEVKGMLHEIHGLVPIHLHKRGPTEFGYSNMPQEIKDFVYSRHPELTAPVPNKRGNGTKKNPTTVTQAYQMLLDGTLEGTLRLVLEKYSDLKVLRMEFGDALYRHIPFNPRSSDQMIDYLTYKGYEIPLSFKDKKPTTSDKLMRRLQFQTKDRVIELSRDIRAFEKMKDSYTGKIGEDGIARGGWIPDKDGRLRTQAFTNSTWQFSSVNPNVFTLPKRRKRLADGFRRCIAAEPGHIMIEFDYRAFHDLTTASLANDEKKWRTARLDPHSYVAAWLIRESFDKQWKKEKQDYVLAGGMPFTSSDSERARMDAYDELATYMPNLNSWLEVPDSELAKRLILVKKIFKKVRDEQAKPLNHGTNFGQSYRRLYFENEEYFESEKQAKDLLLLLKKVYPKTFKWQETLLESLDTKAGQVPYLQSVWGARRWFWDVWIWKKNYQGEWYKAKGQDAEKALAFLPSNHAHGMFRLKLLEMADLGYLDRYELINFPHDAMVFHPPIELADNCIADVKEWMEGPVRELANPILCPEGFSCGVDVQIGPDLGSMKEL